MSSPPQDPPDPMKAPPFSTPSLPTPPLTIPSISTSSPKLVTDEVTDIVPSSDPPHNHFIPSLGAWAKPLHFSPLPSPIASAMPRDFAMLHDETIIAEWPSLTTKSQGGSKKRTTGFKETIPAPALKEDGSFRFPWAAKMKPESRNLYRVASPSYLEDGTPKVTIPSHVLLHGPENQKEYVVGHFYRCSTPPGGLVHAVVNKLWGKHCKIFSKKLSDHSFLFHIPDESSRSWVLQRGLWHIDDCLLFVTPWTPASTLSVPELTTIPVWVTLKNIPDRLYSKLGISHIASGLGEPMLTYKPRLDPTMMGEAKIMVEVELDKAFPQRIVLADRKEYLTLVDVEYSWIPSKCARCGHLGHKEKRCLLPSQAEHSSPNQANTSLPSFPVVIVDHLPQSSIVGVQNDNVTKGINASMSSLATTASLSDHLEPQTAVQLPEMPLLPTHIQDSENVCVGSPATTHIQDSPATTPISIPQAHVVECSTPIDTTSLIADQAIPSRPNTMELNNSIHNINAFALLSGTESTEDDSNTTSFASPFTTQTCIASLSTQVDVDHDSDSGLIQRTRGGREIKPSQKLQEMEWISVTRGNRGRRGRGGTHHY